MGSPPHIQAAHDRKQSKVKYTRWLGDFKCLNIPNYYVLYNLNNCSRSLPTIRIIHTELRTSKSAIKKL